VKPIKMFGLAALATLVATGCVGASSALAGQTSLCEADESPCMAGNTITHVHEESIGHASLLSFVTVECETLFLGDTLNSGLGSPLIVHGKFSYTCLEDCNAEEENGPAEIKVLKAGNELAIVTGEGLVHVICGLNCRYNGVNLEAHALGALTAANETGEVVLNEQEINKESGVFCPSTGDLDIETEPLVKTYISS